MSEVPLQMGSGEGVEGWLWEGCRERRRCSRDTYPEACITKYALVYEVLKGRSLEV